MLRSRPASSRATPTTLCQKCLRKGHYSYECTSSVQERPYSSRASRTQQFLNPKLRPKLNTEIPEEFIKNKSKLKRTTADQAATKQGEGLATPDSEHRRRSRSASYTSVSTISTNRSASSVSPRSRERPRYPERKSHDLGSHKPPKSSEGKPRRAVYDAHDRTRGRKRGRSFSSSSSQQEHDRESQTRRRRSSVSPALRGRPLYGNFKSNTSSSESRSHSRRHRNATESGDDLRESAERPKNAGRRGHFAKSTKIRDNDSDRFGRERSLSPYSKRLMLTQAMSTKKNSK